MTLKRMQLLWVIPLFFLIACSNKEVDPTTLPPTGSPTPTVAAATKTPLATATIPPTITPSPTPILPGIQIESQPLSEDGYLSFINVSSPEDGWLVVLSDQDGAPGTILGVQQVSAGENSGLSLEIVPQEATPTLYARLHKDAGTAGTFEFPGPDSPLGDESGTPLVSFTVEFDFPIPVIEISEQLIENDGLVHVDKVVALSQGWLVIHSLEDGKIGPALGQVPVQEGANEDLECKIRWREASSELIAILYEDVEKPGGFDHRVDMPVLFGGSPVVAEFLASLPPDITVYDQPVIDDKIVLERVISRGPGWVAAYFDEEGQPGRIISSAYVEDGVNEFVELAVDKLAATPTLFLILHEDTGDAGEFEFPIADLPVVSNGQPLTPFTMQTAPGNYLVTRDQSLSEVNSVTISLVVADIDTWVVLYEVDTSGEKGEIIEKLWLAAGVNRDVEVKLPPNYSGQTIIAGLHLDRGVLEHFDFPDGADVLLLRNLSPIQSPIHLVDPEKMEQQLPR